MVNDYSRNVADAINDFLIDDDWHFSFNENTGVFEFNLNLKGRINRVRYTIMVHDNGYTVYATCPVSVTRDDKDMMNAMAEFLCRANYGLRSGNFELDFRDGEIRYKTFTDCSGGAVPTREIVRRSITIPAAMYDRYSNGIVTIMFIGGDPAALVEQCEGRAPAPARPALTPVPDEDEDEDEDDTDTPDDTGADDADTPDGDDADDDTPDAPGSDDDALARALDFIRSLGGH